MSLVGGPRIGTSQRNPRLLDYYRHVPSEKDVVDVPTDKRVDLSTKIATQRYSDGLIQSRIVGFQALDNHE
jgi:hypothetical protein